MKTKAQFSGWSSAAQHQHPALDPVQTAPPKKRKAVPSPKLTRLFSNPSRNSVRAFDSTSSYGSEFHAWVTGLAAKYSGSSAFGALGAAVQQELCEWALPCLWCSALSPCPSPKDAQEWDENADLTSRGLSPQCCSALGFLQDCRQGCTFCFCIRKTGLYTASFACHSSLGCWFLRAALAQQNPNPHWELCAHQAQKKKARSNSSLCFSIAAKGQTGILLSPLLIWNSFELWDFSLQSNYHYWQAVTLEGRDLSKWAVSHRVNKILLKYTD